MRCLLLLMACLAGSASALTAPPSTEVIRNQTELEQLLTQRYATILGTMLDRSSFSIGVLVQLENALTGQEIAAASGDDLDPILPNDLALGVLPMMEQAYREHRQNQLSGKDLPTRIKSVLVQVGLDPRFDPGVQPKVLTWLRRQIDSEFGSRATVDVAMVQKPPPSPAPDAPKPTPAATPQPTPPSATPAPAAAAPGATPNKAEAPRELDALKGLLLAFQPFAAVLVMCLTFVLLLVLWKIFPFRQGDRPPVNVDVKGAVKTAGEGKEIEGAKKATPDKEPAAKEPVREEIYALSSSLCQMARALSPYIDVLLLVWRYDPDEKGLKKLAVFLEATSRLGQSFKVPQPEDERLGRVFRDMAALPAEQHLALLREVYWEVQTLQGLGTKAIERPFSYLARASLEQISAALEKLKPEERSIVLLYCPPEIRRDYLNKADGSIRKAVLETILDMGKASTEVIQGIDQRMKDEIGKAGAAQSAVTLLPMLGGLVDSFGPEEEVRLFKEIRDKPAVREFLRTYPNLIYVDRWPDEMLSLLVREAQPDEVVGLLRLQPDLTQRTLSLCPSMTAELVRDELSKPDKRTPEQRLLAIRQLKQRLESLGARLGSYLGKEELREELRKSA